MSSLAPRLIISEEEFLSIPESTDKVELVDGEVILSPSPSYRHQWILRQVVRALEDWAATQPRKVTVGMAPLDVRFAPGRILQPDAFVLFACVAPEHVGPISEVPALCVEVMSSNRAYDRMTKRLIYAEAGVAELWTVGTDGTVERWCGDRLSDCEVPAQYLTSALLPGFQLAIEQLHI
jgi:Uma2 family endonuclease